MRGWHVHTFDVIRPNNNKSVLSDQQSRYSTISYSQTMCLFEGSDRAVNFISLKSIDIMKKYDDDVINIIGTLKVKVTATVQNTVYIISNIKSTIPMTEYTGSDSKCTVPNKYQLHDLKLQSYIL